MFPRVTERLVVRRFTEGDLEDFLAYQTHPEVMRFQPHAPPTRESAARFLAAQAAGAPDGPGDAGGFVAFAAERREDNRVIGDVTLNVYPRAHGRAEIGWSFHPDYHGRGYAAEAAREVLAFAFSRPGLRRITTHCDTRNVASYRLMERLGMRCEGRQRENVRIGGAWRDTYTYALLRDEWLAAARGGDGAAAAPAAYRHAPEDYVCPFCLLIAGIEDTRRVLSVATDVVYRDAEVTVLVSSHQYPNNPGHVLVIPNRHYENLYELPDALGGSIHAAARAVALAMKTAYGCDGVSTRQHNEPAGYQDVWHYHLHVFPRYPGDELYSSRSRLMDPADRAAYARRLRAHLPGNSPAP